MSYLIVMPFVYGPYFDSCMESLDEPVKENVFSVDNTSDNRGLSESWDMGIDEMRKRGSDWLIVCSPAIRFEDGGRDFDSVLEENKLADVIHFATKQYDGPDQYIRGKSRGYNEGLLGWHLTAIPRRTIDAVGYFDPNFYPLYFEDIDYDLRINKHYNWLPNWKIAAVGAHGTTLAHSITLAGIKAPAEPLISYFATKWGVHPNATRLLGSYEHPFNEEDKSVAFFPPHHGRTWDGL